MKCDPSSILQVHVYVCQTYLVGVPGTIPYLLYLKDKLVVINYFST